MALCLQAGPKPADDIILVHRACEHRDSAGSNRDDGMLGLVGGVPTARTLESAGWAMLQDGCAILGGQSTDRAELVQMVGAPDERDRELIKQQERDGVPAGRLKRCIARRTTNRLGGVRRACWRFVGIYSIHRRKYVQLGPETDTLRVQGSVL